MSANDSKLSSSFSSPEIQRPDEQQQSETAANGVSNNNGENSASDLLNASNNSNNNSSLNAGGSSPLSAATIKMFSSTGIRVDTTRDSGFSDSLADESSSSISTSAGVAGGKSKHRGSGGKVPQSQSSSGIYSSRTEHVLSMNNNNSNQPQSSTSSSSSVIAAAAVAADADNNSGIQASTKFITNNKGQLKSVQEDLNITQPAASAAAVAGNAAASSAAAAAATATTITTAAASDDNGGKEYITIVKTTKVTTKVKHIKASKSSNKKNKKNASNSNASAAAAGGEGNNEEEDENADEFKAVTNTSYVSKSKTSVIRSGPDMKTTETTTEEIINGAAGDNNEEAAVNNNNKESETDDEILINNVKQMNKQIFKVNINKSTEELVFENLSPKLLNQQQQHVLSSDSSQPLQTDSNAVDLNSTVLDSEEILSDYSTHIAAGAGGTSSPRHLEAAATFRANVGAAAAEEEITIPKLINETTIALSDVTSSLLNQPQVELAAAPSSQIEVVKISEPAPSAVKRAKGDDNKATKPKKKRFSFCFSTKSAGAAADEDESPKKKEKKEKKKENKKDNKKSGQQKSEEKPAAAAAVDPQLLSVDVKQSQQQAAAGSSPNAVRYILLDDEQKDRILYLKPDCVELIIRRFIDQSAPLNDLDDANKQTLSKMVSRSLDLLRHDRIENFDRLANKIKEEYDLRSDELDSSASKIDVRLANLLFSDLLKQSLIDEKLLLRLELDKTNSRPYEELIDFGPSITQSIWTEKFSGSAAANAAAAAAAAHVATAVKSAGKIEESSASATVVDNQNGVVSDVAEVPAAAASDSEQLQQSTTEVLTDEINELKNDLNKIVSEEKEKLDKLLSEQTTTTTTTVEKEVEKVVDEMKAQVSSSDDLLAAGANIVLDTIKEPPIVFPSDLENENKPKQQQETENKKTPETAVLVVAQPQKVEAAAATGVKLDKKQSKSGSKKKRSPLACLSCAGSSKLENEDEHPKTTIKPKKEKKKSVKQEAGDEKKPKALTVPAASASLEKRVDSKVKPAPFDPTLFANLDAKPDQVTIDLPNVIEIIRPVERIEVLEKKAVKSKPEEKVEENQQQIKITTKDDYKTTTTPVTPPVTPEVDPLNVNKLALELDLTAANLNVLAPEFVITSSSKMQQQQQSETSPNAEKLAAAIKKSSEKKKPVSSSDDDELNSRNNKNIMSTVDVSVLDVEVVQAPSAASVAEDSSNKKKDKKKDKKEKKNKKQDSGESPTKQEAATAVEAPAVKLEINTASDSTAQVQLPIELEGEQQLQQQEQQQEQQQDQQQLVNQSSSSSSALVIQQTIITSNTNEENQITTTTTTITTTIKSAADNNDDGSVNETVASTNLQQQRDENDVVDKVIDSIKLDPTTTDHDVPISIEIETNNNNYPKVDVAKLPDPIERSPVRLDLSSSPKAEPIKVDESKKSNKKTKKEKQQKKSKETKNKNDDDDDEESGVTSCFSCKGRKAASAAAKSKSKKTKESTEKPKVATNEVKIKIEEKIVVVDVAAEAKKPSSPSSPVVSVDKNLFVGLDRPYSENDQVVVLPPQPQSAAEQESTTEVASAEPLKQDENEENKVVEEEIQQIPIQKDVEKPIKSEEAAKVEEIVEDSHLPNVVASDLLNEENNNKSAAEEIKLLTQEEEKKEEEEEVKQPEVTEEPSKVIVGEEQTKVTPSDEDIVIIKKPSDDIVVLPDVSNQTAASLPSIKLDAQVGQSSTEAVQLLKTDDLDRPVEKEPVVKVTPPALIKEQPKQKKKSSSFSCFKTSKKPKSSKKNVDVAAASKPAPVAKQDLPVLIDLPCVYSPDIVSAADKNKLAAPAAEKQPPKAKKQKPEKVSKKKSKAVEPAAVKVEVKKAENAPATKTVEATVPAATAAVERKAEVQPAKFNNDWAVGLDRKENEPLVETDPSHYKVEKQDESAVSISEPEAKTDELLPVLTGVSEVHRDLDEIVEEPPQTEIVAAEQQPLKVSVEVEQQPKKDEVVQQLTIDSPGAYVKIDREPDHAVVPIVAVTQKEAAKVQQPIKSGDETKVEAALVASSSQKKKSAAKEAKEKKPKRTSILDMPLIDLFTPKSKSATAKKDDSSKSSSSKKSKKEAAAVTASAEKVKEATSKKTTAAAVNEPPMDLERNVPSWITLDIQLPQIQLNKTTTESLVVEEAAKVEPATTTAPSDEKEKSVETEAAVEEKPVDNVDEIDRLKQEIALSNNQQQQLEDESKYDTDNSAIKGIVDEILKMTQQQPQKEVDDVDDLKKSLASQQQHVEIEVNQVQVQFQQQQYTISTNLDENLKAELKLKELERFDASNQPEEDSGAEKSTEEETKTLPHEGEEVKVETETETVQVQQQKSIDIKDIDLSELNSKKQPAPSSDEIKPIEFIKLPTREENVAIEVHKPQAAATVVSAEQKTAAIKKQKEKKTSFIDLPLIDIFVPKEGGKVKKQKQTKTATVAKAKKEEKKKSETTKATAAPAVVKQDQPVYIDMPIIDLIKPTAEVAAPAPSVVDKTKKKEKPAKKAKAKSAATSDDDASKISCFSCKARKQKRGGNKQPQTPTASGKQPIVKEAIEQKDSSAAATVNAAAVQIIDINSGPRLDAPYDENKQPSVAVVFEQQAAAAEDDFSINVDELKFKLEKLKDLESELKPEPAAAEVQQTSPVKQEVNEVEAAPEAPIEIKQEPIDDQQQQQPEPAAPAETKSSKKKGKKKGKKQLQQQADSDESKEDAAVESAKPQEQAEIVETTVKVEKEEPVEKSEETVLVVDSSATKTDETRIEETIVVEQSTNQIEATVHVESIRESVKEETTLIQQEIEIVPVNLEHENAKSDLEAVASKSDNVVVTSDEYPKVDHAKLPEPVERSVSPQKKIEAAAEMKSVAAAEQKPTDKKQKKEKKKKTDVDGKKESSASLISCFSCKARKGKKEKKTTAEAKIEKTSGAADKKQSPLAATAAAVDETAAGSKKVDSKSPIVKQSFNFDLFKGLDKPSGDVDQNIIIEFPSYFNIEIVQPQTKEEDTTKPADLKEKKVESPEPEPVQKTGDIVPEITASDLKETAAVAAHTTTTTTEVDLDSTLVIDLPPIVEAPLAQEPLVITAPPIPAGAIIAAAATEQIDQQQTSLPEAAVVTPAPVIVKQQEFIDFPSVISPNVVIETKKKEKKPAVTSSPSSSTKKAPAAKKEKKSPSQQKKQKSESFSSKMSCFLCGANKKKSAAESSQPAAAADPKQSTAEQSKKSVLSSPVITPLITSDLDRPYSADDMGLPPLSELHLSSQPPKKPPRGQLDTSVVDDDLAVVSSTTSAPTEAAADTVAVDDQVVHEQRSGEVVVDDHQPAVPVEELETQQQQQPAVEEQQQEQQQETRPEPEPEIKEEEQEVVKQQRDADAESEPFVIVEENEIEEAKEALHQSNVVEEIQPVVEAEEKKQQPEIIILETPKEAEKPAAAAEVVLRATAAKEDDAKKEKEKKKKSGHTSVIDMPLIDLFSPKDRKSKEKKTKSEAAAPASAPAPPQITVQQIETVEKTKPATPPTSKSSKKEKKKSSHTTSCIDMPLIDILKPKKSDSKKKISKAETKESKQKQPKLIVDESVDVKIYGPVGAAAAAEPTKSAEKSVPIPISIPDLIDGGHRHEDGDEEGGDRVEITKEVEQITRVIKTIGVAETEPTRDGPAKVIVTELPDVIDLDASGFSKAESYTTKKVTTWTTDPLPHVQIGLHRVGENPAAPSPPQQLSPSSLSSLPSKDVHPIVETKLRNLDEIKTEISQAIVDTSLPSPRMVDVKVSRGAASEAATASSSSPKPKLLTPVKPDNFVDFPSCYAAEIMTASEKAAAAAAAKKQSDSVLKIRSLQDDERKLLKSNKSRAVEYLFNAGGNNLKSSDIKKNEKSKGEIKEIKRQEKFVNKLNEYLVKQLISKSRKITTYEELKNKLIKKFSSKSGSDTVERCVNQLRIELENGNLIEHLKQQKKKKSSSSGDKAAAGKESKEAKNADLKSKQLSSSTDRLAANESADTANVIRRCPSLTWREANERARILFYKGRVPSIHYNEKRDSFRVSMITSVHLPDGGEKKTEVPVFDDDVRRLLNSCGLYWDGESISLLNKSDEIFTDAQQEAFDFIQSINAGMFSPTSEIVQETTSKSVSTVSSSEKNKVKTVTTTTTRTRTSVDGNAEQIREEETTQETTTNAEANAQNK